eukprot:749342-Hanusia_phi.AAC.3
MRISHWRVRNFTDNLYLAGQQAFSFSDSGMLQEQWGLSLPRFCSFSCQIHLVAFFHFVTWPLFCLPLLAIVAPTWRLRLSGRWVFTQLSSVSSYTDVKSTSELNLKA